MTTMNCEQLNDLAPELALGVLTGRERADAYAHLDRCAACRQLVNSLSVVTDELLRSFAPSVEPPAGFETRVLAAIAPPRRRRWLNAIPTLAAAACVALLVGVAVLLSGSRPAFAAAEMRTTSGAVVGWIYVDHDTVGMKMPGWADQIKEWGGDGDIYSLRLTDSSGSEQRIPVSLRSDSSWWATIDADHVTDAALVDDSGHVWCHADLN